MAALPTRHLNIQVIAGASAKSVTIKLDDVLRVENDAPFALFGNTGSDYAAGSLPVGKRTLSAEAFSGSGAKGTGGAFRTIQFEVSDSAVVDDRLTLGTLSIVGRNTSNGPDEDPTSEQIVTDGSSFDIGSGAFISRQLNLLIDVGPTVGSVLWRVDGATFVTTDNVFQPSPPDDGSAPMSATSGLFNSPDYSPLAQPFFFAGAHVIQITPYSGANATGSRGPTRTVHVTLTDGDQTDGFRWAIDLDGDGSLYDESALGDQDTDTTGTVTQQFASRMYNVGSTPLTLDGAFQFVVSDFDPDNPDTPGRTFPTGGLVPPDSTASQDITPAGSNANHHVTRFTGREVVIIETVDQTSPGVMGQVSPTYSLSYEFFSPSNQSQHKVLQPGESIAVTLDTDTDGSLRSGSGSPVKAGKKKKVF